MNPYVQVAVWVIFALAMLWLRQSVTESVRQGTEKVLADYRHGHAQQLAEIDAANQRRGAEFSLFKQRQHAVYAKLYARQRKATDLYGKFIGSLFGPNFRLFGEESVNAYLRQRGIARHEAERVLLALHNGDGFEAVEAEMHKLHRRTNLRDARRAYQRAVNYEVLNELYLSEPARGSVFWWRQAMGTLIAYVEALVEEEDRGEEERDFAVTERRLHVKSEAEVAAAGIYRVMRQEIWRGDAELTAGPGVPAKM